MDTIDSEAEVSGKSWIRIMFIFSVMLILIGLALIYTGTSSSDTYAWTPTFGDFGPWMLFAGGSIIVQTGIIISFRFLKSLVQKNS